MNEVADATTSPTCRASGARSRGGGTSAASRSGVQRAIGFDQKVAQYDAGERFVREVVERVGHERLQPRVGVARDLPQPGEVADPDRWIARVAR